MCKFATLLSLTSLINPIFGKYCPDDSQSPNCHGIIHKYIMLNTENLTNEGYNYYDAQSTCNSLYGTKLASIHSERDYLEAISLMNQPINTWIGLTNINNDGIYYYEDGTEYDFQVNPIDINTNSSSDECIQISPSLNYTFDVCPCEGDLSRHNALCNAPSLLCSDRAEWTIISNEGSVSDDTDCTKLLTENTETVINNKQWYNGQEILLIDYTFSMQSDTEEIGRSGVIIYNSMGCDYYYIGVSSSESMDDHYLYLIYHESNIDHILSQTKIKIDYIETTFYLLSIQILNGNQFNIYLNDILHITYNHNVNTNVLTDEISGYIGIKTSHSAFTVAKSLFISGIGITMDSDLSFSAINIECSVPSTTSSRDIKVVEIEEEYDSIGYGIIILTTFEYVFSPQDSVAITNVFNEIIGAIIYETVSQQCLQSDIFSEWIESDTIKDVTIVNATLFVCESSTQSSIISIVNDAGFEEQLIQIINQTIHLQISIDKVSIQTDQFIFTLTTETEAPEILLYHTKDAPTSELTVIFILTIVGAILFVLILVICIYFAISSMVKKKIRSLTLEDTFSTVHKAQEVERLGGNISEDTDEKEQADKATAKQSLDLSEPRSPTFGGEPTVTVLTSRNSNCSDTELYGPGPTTAGGLDLIDENSDLDIAVNMGNRAISASELKFKINECKIRNLPIQEETEDIDGKEHEHERETQLPPPPLRGFTTDQIEQKIQEISDSSEEGGLLEHGGFVTRGGDDEQEEQVKDGDTLGVEVENGTLLESGHRFSIASDHGVNTASYF